MRRARGFTVLELLFTVVVIGAATSVAIPASDELKRRALASEMLADVEAVRAGTYGFYSDSGYFPSEVGGGNVPANLGGYLPRNYSFKKKSWTIDFRQWTLKNTPRSNKSPVIIGVTVTPTDAKIAATAMAMYGDQPKFVVGNKYTFIIVGM